MTDRTEIELVAWHPSGFTLPFIVHANQSVLIGKSNNCGVRLRGHDISDIHCSIGFEEGQLWVQDWMSASGTLVNGTPVTSKSYVGYGCVVEIGSYKIELSTAQKTTFMPNGVDDAKYQATSAYGQEDNSIEHSSRGSIQQTAVPAVVVAAQGEMSPDEPQTSTDLALTEQDEHAPPTFNDDSADSLPQPEVGLEPLTQEETTYDRETVELLLAEIDDLRAALAQADATQATFADSKTDNTEFTNESEDIHDSDRVLSRIQELSEEANRAEERVLLLEEMLHAAEDANRSEVEERTHLEAWVGDIEKRIGQREAEHAAELKAMRERLDSADKANVRLRRQLQQAAADSDCTDTHNGDVLDQLQRENGELQNALAAVTKDLRQLKQKLENQAGESDTALREERAKIAREHAEMSRLKYEYAQKIKELEESPVFTAHADPSRQSLLEHRQYLREINTEKNKRHASKPLSSRLKSIWNMLD